MSKKSPYFFSISTLVDKLLKYTGYGNAAGLLFSRSHQEREKIQYSEDEDSDTEEYKTDKPL